MQVVDFLIFVRDSEVVINMTIKDQIKEQTINMVFQSMVTMRLNRTS